MNALHEEILAEIAENLDDRRLQITGLRRVLLPYVGKPLENTAVSMSVPMIYAHWEGYVKEVCQLYLEHVEAAVPRLGRLQPALLGYLWRPKLKRMAGGLSFAHRVDFAECALTGLSRPVRFEDAEKAIDTQSNLKFSALEGIAKDLCLDIAPMTSRRQQLDAFVHMRNNIAHGSNPQGLKYSDFEDKAELALWLMEEFEKVLRHSIQNACFCRRQPAPTRPPEAETAKIRRHGGSK